MLSVVVPLYNEKESLTTLHAEIEDIARTGKLDLETIFVDDGSTDGSWRIIRELAGRHDNVQGIRFRRNFGKAAALTAGFRAARGDIVITLDADLQDDPAEIPNLLKVLDADKDVVSGWKKVRKDPWHKVWPSRLFNFLVSKLTGVHLHDHNCGMKCYRAEALAEIKLYGELHRFTPVLAAARGFRIGEVVIQHRPRRFGRSKYGVGRFVKGLLDVMTVTFLTGFGHRPQHLLGTLGLLSFFAGSAGMAYLSIYWIVRLWNPGLTPVHERPMLLYSVAAVIVGAQFMSLGLLAELITAYMCKEEDSYSIAERAGENEE